MLLVIKCVETWSKNILSCLGEVSCLSNAVRAFIYISEEAFKNALDSFVVESNLKHPIFSLLYGIGFGLRQSRFLNVLIFSRLTSY